jgi:hypothetical protein
MFKKIIITALFAVLFIIPALPKSQVIQAQNYFYYSQGNDPWSFVRRDADGTNLSTIYTPPVDYVYQASADASIEKVYFYDNNVGSGVRTIFQSDADGSNRVAVVNNAPSIKSLAAGKGYFYYSLSSTPWTLVRRNSDGSGITTIYTPPVDFADFVAIDPSIDILYFIDGDIGGGNKVLYKSNLDGSNRVAIKQNLPSVTSLTAGSGYVFYAISDNPWTVIRLNSDGSNSATVYTAPVEWARELAFDGSINKLYIYDQDVGSSKRVIYSCDPDGANRTAVVDGVGNTVLCLATFNSAPAPSNTPPTAASFTASPIYQNTAYQFSTAQFYYSDADSDMLDHVRIAVTPSQGTLWLDFDSSGTLNGAESEISNGGTVSKFNLDGGYLKYLNTSGISSSFTFDVNDGTDYSVSTYTATLTVIPLPSVATEPATGVTSTGATLNGIINANGVSTTVTFEYGLTTAYGTTVTADQSPVSGTADTPVTKTLTGLGSGTTYHFRTVGVSTGGTTYGFDKTFTTVPGIPVNIAISNDGSEVTVSWDEVTGASSYKVFSSTDPYSGFMEVGTGSYGVTSWTGPFDGNKLFYYVVAVN